MTTIDQPVEILLVEDSPEDAELAMRALTQSHLANRIHWVEDGAAALDFFFANGHSPPRVVLLDLKLPKVDGLEVLRRLKADERTRHVPVVMMTSSQEESDLVESYELGANSYIVKPVEFDSFTQAVRTVGMYWLLLNKPPPGQ